VSRVEETLRRVTSAGSWDERVQEIRRIPEQHGKTEQKTLYAEVARALYRPHLSAHFAFVPRRDDYELRYFRSIYERTAAATGHFTETESSQLAAVLERDPQSLLVFRTILGYTPHELAVATREVAQETGERGVSDARIKSLEQGGRISSSAANLLAATIHRLITSNLWGGAPEGLRSKMDKADTARGWTSVSEYAASGVPYEIFLHQRHTGGAFRQLLDATSEERGAILEAAVAAILDDLGIPYLRTGSKDQGEIVRRFNLSVTPAPDFVIFDAGGNLRALLECKLTNDGGTARDKASRFAKLRQESGRLGGVPLFAVLDGLGWERVNDALGPVVEACDGLVFSLENLPTMLEVRPLPDLAGQAD